LTASTFFVKPIRGAFPRFWEKQGNRRADLRLKKQRRLFAKFGNDGY